MWDCLCSPTGASFECMYIAILSQVASVLGCMPQCLHGPACQINGWQTDLLHERAGTTRRRGCCRKSRVGCSCAELGPADTATAAEADPTCSCCCGHAELATADAAAKGGCCDVDVDGGAGTELRTSAWCFRQFPVPPTLSRPLSRLPPATLTPLRLSFGIPTRSSKAHLR